MKRVYRVSEIISIEGTEEDVLQRAASLSYLADFAVSEAVVSEAKKRGLPPLPAEKFMTMPGKGAKALIGGMEVRVGSPKLLVEEKIPVPVSFGENIKALSKEGKIIVIVLSGRSLSGAIILAHAEVSEPVQEAVPPAPHKKWLSAFFKGGKKTTKEA